MRMFRHFALLLLLLPLFAAKPAQAATRDADGKYTGLIKTFACPSDKAKYGAAFDAGHFAAGTWCGQTTPEGYWVWVAPNWYIWAKEAPVDPLKKASAHGKYSQLLAQVTCPAKLKAETGIYRDFAEAGHYDAVNYCGKSLPEAYWVWVKGTWYLWKVKDLKAAGYTITERQVKLSKQTITLRFEHAQANQAWAEQQLKWLSVALQEMEQTTGLPYPGANPYPIAENPDLPLLGLAGPSGMELHSPPMGSYWTMLHETVHIWNAGVRPKYISEGLANFISYQMMNKFRLPFDKEETFPGFVANWRRIQSGAKDLPLDDHYDELPQGKAMTFWAMAYELGGPTLIKDVFVKANRDRTLNQAGLAALLGSHGVARPQDLLSGWVYAGPYKIKQTADAGAVRYPLAGAWPGK